MKQIYQLSIIIVLFASLNNVSAQIGINTVNPDTNAILDIYSSDKGVKFPEILDTAASNPPANKSGYLVYHTQPKKFRFWNSRFWESLNPFKVDNNDNITAPRRLHVEGDSLTAPNATVRANNFIGYGTIPKGGILMWSGAITGNFGANGLGTGSMDGWALCNGNNGTPNLSGRFIAGYSGAGEYTMGAKTGGGNTLTLTADNLPTHSHTPGTLATETNGLHSHRHKGFKNVDDGTSEQAQSRNMFTNDPPDYGGEAAGAHTHEISGSTAKTGGTYTYNSYSNPERLSAIEKCFFYTVSIYGTNYYVSNNYINSFSTSGSNYYYYAQIDENYNGEYNQFIIYYFNTSTYVSNAIGMTFISNYSGSNFTLTGLTCETNPSYVSGTPYVNPLHISSKPLGATIITNEQWAVQPIDNRPSYYVLAFIMRIK